MVPWLQPASTFSPDTLIYRKRAGRRPADNKIPEVTTNEEMDSRGDSRRGAGLARSGPGAAAYRDQVQPCGGARYAQGQRLAQVQGAGREIHQRQGRGGSLPELAALQGQ